MCSNKWPEGSCLSLFHFQCPAGKEKAYLVRSACECQGQMVVVLMRRREDERMRMIVHDDTHIRREKDKRSNSLS
jgi:hypothetical protein